MQISASLRRFLLASCLVSLLPGCLPIQRIDASGQPVHTKNPKKPVVGTHVAPTPRP